MNDETTRTKIITIVETGTFLGDKQATKRLIETYEEVINLTIPVDRKKDAHGETRDYQFSEDQEK